MRVDELAPAPGARKSKKRVARGIGGKGGKTAGRGGKGQYARNTVARGFEGGQTPLKQRVPKLKGFNNPFRVEYSPVNLDQLEGLDLDKGSSVDPESLVASGLVRKGTYVKILGRGELKAKLNVSAHAVSKAAETAITDAGGSVTLIPLPFKAEGRAGRPAVKGNQFTNR
jgi:large subunit ribosomal protein L15